MPLKSGMYVRCPLDKDDKDEPRVFFFGQIIEVDTDNERVLVKFHDLGGLRGLYEHIPRTETWFDIDSVKRCAALNGSDFIVNRNPYGQIVADHHGQIVAFYGEVEDGFYFYYGEIDLDGKKDVGIFSESDMQIPLSRADVSPLTQLLQYEFQSPYWFKHRNVVMDSMHVIRNATYGFETLIGSRVYLMPHQIDAIIRAVTDTPCRLMLADEVGLGKTIEACVIMKGLKRRRPELRTLIITPFSLVHQWQTELSYKFWIDAGIYPETDNGDCVIFPLELLTSKDAEDIIASDWNLCIVDETHRLLDMSSEYAIIQELGTRSENLLLLSATPIQHRREEFLRLLILLTPERFGNMTEQEFTILLEKQGEITSIVQRLMQDLDYYSEDQLADSFIKDLSELSTQLNDKVFDYLVKGINSDASDQGLEAVRLALAYLGENYQIERRIIRHRRAELQDKLPSRKLEEQEYIMAGSDFDFYEWDTYEAVLNYLDFITREHGQKCIKFVKLLLAGMFSSPWALIEVLKSRKTEIHSGPGDHPSDREIKMINQVTNVCNFWLSAVIDEFKSLNCLLDEDPDLIRGRLGHVVNFLDQTLENEKYVVFSNFKETILPLRDALVRRFGGQAVATFYRGKNAHELQIEVDRFQNDRDCRFILCDSLGGEGRNFQHADAVIHVDLPWMPSELEQRIGRVDRIGRLKDVNSIVFFSLNTVEEQLYGLWNKGLNIFQESLSGLEIALGDIQTKIDQSIVSDVTYGLYALLEPMKAQLKSMIALVARERYFDLCRQLDHRMEDQLTKLIKHFDDGEGKTLARTMLEWTSAVGLGADISKDQTVITFKPRLFRPNATKQTLFSPPDLGEVIRKAGKSQHIQGTFTRSVALKSENLLFFAPGDSLFDAITENARECYRGTCCSFAIKLPTITRECWGLVFIWSVNFDIEPLISSGLPLSNVALAQGYIPLNPITTVHGFSDEDQQLISEIDPKLLTHWFSPQHVAHLGRRNSKKDFLDIKDRFNTSNLEWVKSQFSMKEWKSLVDAAYKKGLGDAQQQLAGMIQIDAAKADFSRRFYGKKASSMYYGRNMLVAQDNETESYKNVLQGLLKGLRHTEIKLDAAALLLGVPEDGLLS